MRMFPKCAISQIRVGNTLVVKYSDNTVKLFNIYDLAVKWFNMSNDTFYDYYGFNFNPHSFSGVYEEARRRVYGKG